MTAAMFLDVRFYFLCFLRHGRKLCVFRLIKAVIADAEYSKILFQQRNDSPKIAFQWQQVPGSSKSAGALFFTELVNLNIPTPAKYLVLALSSV